MFNNIFSFNGRINKTEYSISILIVVVGFTLLELFQFPKNITYLKLVLNLVIWFFLIAQGAKRCHDIGNNGWFQFIPFYIVYLMFANSQFGRNYYGESPR